MNNFYKLLLPNYEVLLNKIDYRTKGILLNIYRGGLVKILSIGIGLILVPIVINYLTAEKYGVWLTLTSVISWFSFFDIGFSNGFRNKFAEAKAKNDIIKCRAYISSTYFFVTAIFFCLWIIFILLNTKINWVGVLNAKNITNSELSSVALIVISFFCLQFPLQTINSLLIADQKNAISDLINALGQLFALFLLYILVIFSTPSLYKLAIALSSAPCVVFIIATIYFFKNKYSHFRPRFSLIQISLAKDILGLGVNFFLIQVAFVVIYQMTNIIIAQIEGSESVSVYNVAYKLFSISIMSFSIIITPFWTAFTDAFIKNDYNWMAKAYKKLRLVFYGIVIFVFILFSLSPLLFKLWLGSKLIIPINISLVLSIYMIITIWCTLHSNLLNGLGKIKIQLYLAVFATLLNIPLSWFMGIKYGLIGIISASIILSILSAIITSKQVKLIINGKATGIWLK